MIPPRYLSGIRHNEIATACNHALRGESLCFVGMAGVGKSNVVRILRYKADIKQQYLGLRAQHVHHVVVDGTTWEKSAASLSSLMLMAVEPLMEELKLTLPASKVILLDETAQLHRRLFDSVRLICSRPDTKLIFVLDDFDDVIAQGSLPMLENLSAMRNAENREKLSYVIITKRLPHKLAAHADELRKSKFYDLFRYNIYALTPYVREDALQMLRHINAVAEHPLSRDQLATLLWLSGHHARLMKILFDTWMKRPPTDEDVLSYFSRQSDIRIECRRILDALHAQEAAVARRFIRAQVTPEDAPTVRHLVTRGFITDVDHRQVFSPLMAAYLLTDGGGAV